MPETLHDAAPSGSHADTVAIKLFDTLCALEEYRLSRPLEFYRPHATQADFHASRARIRLLSGANQSGKTEAGMAEVAAAVLGYRPWLPKDDPSYYMPFRPPVSIRIIATDFAKTVRPVIEPKLLKWFPAMLKSRGYKINRHQPGAALEEINTPNGSQIHIITHTQFEKLSSGEGWTGHYLAIDEPCPESAWVSSWRGCIANNGYAWLTLTPSLISNHTPFIYDQFYVKSSKFHKSSIIDCWEMSMYDNVGYGIADAAYVEDYKLTVPQQEWASRVYGRFSHLVGPVFNLEGEDAKHYWIEPFEIPKHWTHYIAIDPHPSKDTYISFCAVNPKNEKFFWHEIKTPQPADIIARAIIEKVPSVQDFHGTTTILIDPSYQAFVNSAKNSANFVSVLRNNGIKCKIDTFEHRKGSVNASIMAVCQQLRPGDNPMNTTIKFFRTLTGHRYQMGRYLWGDGNKPVEEHDDFPACVRAIESYGSTFVSKKERRATYNPDDFVPLGA
jgi:hypothetical protein